MTTLEYAEKIREALEHGRYAEARLLAFQLVCQERRAQQTLTVTQNN